MDKSWDDKACPQTTNETTRLVRGQEEVDKACPRPRRGGQALSVPLNVRLDRGQSLSVWLMSNLSTDKPCSSRYCPLFIRMNKGCIPNQTRVD
uniref:Uncharacterized protein n=1 Tax=Acrobeloides nanus TaxID=290746 RepID=A0A914D3N2_9BILA